MTAAHVIWDSRAIPNAVLLHDIVGVEKRWQLVEGVPRTATWPNTVTFSTSPDYPKNKVLVDNLANTNRLVVTSKRLKEFLESQGVAKLEYLPLTIVNHKKKPMSSDYFLVHALEPVECIDVEQSQLEWNSNHDTINEVRKLVLDESKIPADRAVFRLKPFYDIVLVRRDLAQAIDAAGFTGIEWHEWASFKTY